MPALWDWGFRNNYKFEEYRKRWGGGVLLPLVPRMMQTVE